MINRTDVTPEQNPMDPIKFRLKTLLECGDEKILVSTAGEFMVNGEMWTIGSGRFYETMAFDRRRGEETQFDSEWGIWAETVEELPENPREVAKAMHEAAVVEIALKMQGLPKE